MTNTIPGSRMWRALPAALLAGAIALTGCSTSADGTDGGTVENPLPPAEGTTQYPLALDTWAGETTLDERPERIAVIGFNPNLDALAALDVTPVYALTEEPWSWRDPEWVSDIEHVDTATRKDDINFEAIAASDPDLIVATDFINDETQFDRLSTIAPVLDRAEVIHGDKRDWRDSQRAVGEALDLGHAAEDAISETEEAVRDIAEAHPEFDGKTITIGQDYGPEFGLSYYTVTDGTAENLMTDLGFEPNPLAENFVDDDVVSDENQKLLDADVLVMIYGDEEIREARESNALFRSVPAVAEDRYVSLSAVDGDPTGLALADGRRVDGAQATWVLRRGQSVESIPWALDVVADEWLSTVELP